MRDALAILAGIIAISATAPYIVNTIRGKTRPNIVTWFTWASLSAITAVAAFSGHAYQTAIFAGALAACDYVIVIVGLRHGLKKYTKFDVICQILALVGIVLWRLTGVPAVAVAIVIIADLIGALPTYRHSWHMPHEETWQTFAYGSVAALLAIFSVKNLNFISLGYPIYIFLSCVSFLFTIKYRLRKLPQRTSRNPAS
jgi:hypothetical protein